MVKVTHLCLGLCKDGAETMLYNLIKYKKETNITYKVISLGTSHYYEELISSLGVEVVNLDIKRKPIKTVLRAIKHIKGSDLLCCWMYHTCILGYFLNKFAKARGIIWLIRHADLNPRYNKTRTLRIVRLCAKLSKKVSCIIYNGYLSQKVHESAGFDRSKSFVLSNGCDISRYTHQESAKEKLCRELNIPSDCKIVLSVCRYNPIKDIPTFIKSFKLIHHKNNNAIAVMCGRGVDISNKDLTTLIKNNGLAINKNIFLLGDRSDLPIVMSACDIYILHSAGEAFPNTLLEAMACGACCIATDVGDVRNIITSKWFVVNPGDAAKIAEKAKLILSLTPDKLNKISELNRLRIESNFNIKKMVLEYEKIFMNIERNVIDGCKVYFQAG